MLTKTWDEMTPLEQAHITWWDMYKDAHGVRPRGISTTLWTLQDYDREFEYLNMAIAAAIAEDKLREERGIAKFEARVAKLVATGYDRNNAIAIIAQLEGVNGDLEYLCWTLDLPYNYFKKEA
jgi:hypothetical protein